MAYQESTVTALTDIPPLVAAFAAAHGWTVGGTSSVPILTRASGGLSFKLQATITNSPSWTHVLEWSQSGGSGEVTSTARILSPRIRGNVTAPAVSIPSKVYLFADSTPQPFIAIVIEYGFNSYRHLYLGNIVKASTYSGGEVIAGANPFNALNSARNWREGQYLFNGINPEWNGTGFAVPTNTGGCYVNHADNAVKWRKFYAVLGNMTSFTGSEVIGGFNDDINSGYIQRARSSFSGVDVLSPINLYAAVPITGDCTFAPLGYPAGVRHVNMQDLEPAAEFTIGSQTWKVFPAFSKSTLQTIPIYPGPGWGDGESSYFVGYAYPKN